MSTHCAPSLKESQVISAPYDSLVLDASQHCRYSIRPTGNSNRRRSSKHLARREPLFFLIMRINLKVVLGLLSFAVIVTIVLYMRSSETSFSRELIKQWDRQLYQVEGGGALALRPVNNNAVNDVVAAATAASGNLQDIKCLINQEYTVECKRDDVSDEVYVPFSFIRDYFEIKGSLSAESENGRSVFHWMHSNAKVNMPKGKYNAHGLFTYFENYNVEVRDRVKCISAAEGVPISTQWEKRGYFYPTQIAQFALSHYSKNLTESAPRIRVMDDSDGDQMEFFIPKSSNLSRIWYPKLNTTVGQFETAIDFDSAISASVNQSLDLVLDADVLLATNSSSLIVSLLCRETKTLYRLHYIPVELVLSVQDHNIYYGLGSVSLNRWRHLTRDLVIDVQKGISNDRKSTTKLRRSDLSVVAVAFLGVGLFDNITFATYNHLAHFYDAAEWFVNHQDTRSGGWVNPVRRNINGFAELKAGWLSAMGQGHAISVLSRAYWHSGGDKRYLKAASLGLKPFRVPSTEGGVLARFMDKYNWYEEYPTHPGSFVLNGFIYSLLGLYDLNATAPSSIAREANKLFQQGMVSLKNMLLLYDTGSGSIYDLRHLSLGVAPNLARWDYHATHVNQLLLLATIDNDPIILQTAERWKGYMFGKRAKHN